MKVNLEFNAEEIEALGWKWLTRLVQVGAKSLGGLFDGIDPKTGSVLTDLIMKAQQAVLHSSGRGGPPPWRSAPSPFGTTGASQNGAADNVRPMNPSPGVVERCFAIESSKYIEAGIACCKCAGYNGLQRTECRNCGHKLCVLVPPPTEPANPPSAL